MNHHEESLEVPELPFRLDGQRLAESVALILTKGRRRAADGSTEWHR
jgi:hypothetical protein